MVELVAAILGALVGAFGAGIVRFVAWIFEEHKKSKSLRRMLFAEIFSFVGVIDGIGLASSFERLVQSPADPWWAHEMSKENYFALFEANAANLGSLAGESHLEF